MWGRVIRSSPSATANAHEPIAGSRLEIFDGVGHLPQVEGPARFVAVLTRFCEETEPAGFDSEASRARIKGSTDGLRMLRTRRRTVRSPNAI